MNLPPSVRDAVVEDVAQRLRHWNQVQNTEKKLAILTGSEETAPNTFSELEDFINDHLSTDLGTAEAEMNLFLVNCHTISFKTIIISFKGKKEVL